MKFHVYMKEAILLSKSRVKYNRKNHDMLLCKGKYHNGGLYAISINNWVSLRQEKIREHHIAKELIPVFQHGKDMSTLKDEKE